MRALICASLATLLLGPAVAHAEGKPRVMGFTRKALKSILVPQLANAPMMSARSRGAMKMNAFMNSESTTEIQLTGKPGNGFVGFVSAKKSYYPGKVIVVSQRPVGAAAFYSLPMPMRK